MKAPKIYLETTIFNFPFADDAPQYKEDTLKLFEEIKAGKFEPYTSVYTIAELQAEPNQENRNRMMRIIVDYNIKVLERDNKSDTLAELYIQEGAVKASYPSDALHIAIAAVNGLDFIVSLNFQHIVKRKTIESTAKINSREGYKQVGIYQPSEVINDDG